MKTNEKPPSNQNQSNQLLSLVLQLYMICSVTFWNCIEAHSIMIEINVKQASSCYFSLNFLNIDCFIFHTHFAVAALTQRAGAIFLPIIKNIKSVSITRLLRVSKSNFREKINRAIMRVEYVQWWYICEYFLYLYFLTINKYSFVATNRTRSENLNRTHF